jgi:YVTN family beta-propeller protein
MIDMCSMHPLANTGVHPLCVAVNLNINTIYVANRDSNTLSVIDCNGFSGKTDLVVNTITVGKYPEGVAVNPYTNMIYYRDNTTSIIDSKTNSVVNTINVGFRPNGLAVNPIAVKKQKTML